MQNGVNEIVLLDDNSYLKMYAWKITITHDPFFHINLVQFNLFLYFSWSHVYFYKRRE